MELKILQINANNSTTAHDIAAVVAVKNGCDFICISEPNRRSCRNRKTYANETYSAAIHQNGQSHAVIGHRTGRCFTCIETPDTAIYNIYLSPNQEIEEFLDDLEDIQGDMILSKSLGKEVVITGDFNAKNSVWRGGGRRHYE